MGGGGVRVRVCGERGLWVRAWARVLGFIFWFTIFCFFFFLVLFFQKFKKFKKFKKYGSQTPRGAQLLVFSFHKKLKTKNCKLKIQKFKKKKKKKHGKSKIEDVGVGVGVCACGCAVLVCGCGCAGSVGVAAGFCFFFVSFREINKFKKCKKVRFPNFSRGTFFFVFSSYFFSFSGCVFPIFCFKKTQIQKNYQKKIKTQN